MASPVVASTATSSTNTAGTNHVVTLPSGIAAGDLIIICMNIGSTAATLNAHADYTELLDENSATGLKILYRWAAGGETNPTLVSSASTRDATATFRITGAADPATQAPEIGTTATGSSTTPDPPTVTPTGGSKDYLFITFCGSAGEQADDGSYCTAFPTNYTADQLEKTCGVAGTNLGGLIAATARQATAASENPGTFTVSENNTWRAQTIAVHPDSRIFVSGGVASESDAGVAGQVQQIYTTAPATSDESVPSGQVQQIYTAGPATSDESVPAGTVDQAAGGGQTIPGGVASEDESVPVGQVQQVYIASPASESDSVPVGQVQQVYTASPASESDSVPVGQVQQVYTSGPATSSETVPAGKVLQVYTSGPATSSESVPAGTINQGGAQTIAGGVASESNTIPVGQVQQIYTSAPAQEADSVPTGTVAQIYTSTPAQEADTAVAGSVQQAQAISGGVARENDSVPVGHVQQIGALEDVVVRSARLYTKSTVTSPRISKPETNVHSADIEVGSPHE